MSEVFSEAMGRTRWLSVDSRGSRGVYSIGDNGYVRNLSNLISPDICVLNILLPACSVINMDSQAVPVAGWFV